MDDGGPIGWIREVVLNTPDPSSLARFWSLLLGGSPVEWHFGWVTLEPPPHGQRLSFQASDPADVKPRGEVHVDVLVEDLGHAHQRVLAVGGTYVGEHWSRRPGRGGEPIPWRVYTDPAGHPFCLVVR